MSSFLIVGSGYRAEYFARVAAAHPDLFRAMFLCRSPQKAALMTAHTGAPATDRLEDALAFRPDFVVVAVDRGHMADVTEEWALRGYPVVAETPVGASWAQLDRIWALSRDRGAKIVSCEQYQRHPVIARGLDLVRSGRIGRPLSASLSLAHDYHGISLIRRMLLVRGESYSLRAARTAAGVVATDSRYGAILDGSTVTEERDTAFITFDSGKTAVYDFSPVQYRTFIRSRHLTVRGDRGEWCDRIVMSVDGENQPERLFLMPELPPAYRALDTQALRDLRRTWTPELHLDTVQDEYAIAAFLMDMDAYLQGGPAPYPLSDALDDAVFWLLLTEAVRHPWQEYRPPVVYSAL